jgi:hypothetical protein
VRDVFAFDFVHVRADVDSSFLAQEADEFLVKPPVVRREALVCYLFAGQVHPNSMEASRTICLPHAEERSEEADADRPDRIMMYKTSLLDAATIIEMF